MAITGENREALEFVGSKPDVMALSAAYEETRTQLNEFMEQKSRDFDSRFQVWAGKSRDNRKHARGPGDSEPFPWDGASDMDCPLLDDVINSHRSMIMSGIRRANLVATPVETGDVERASVVSMFLKWLINARMPEFHREMERGVNSLLQNGMMVSYVYWDARDQKVQHPIVLAEAEERVPGITDMIMDVNSEDNFAQVFQETYGVGKKKAMAMVEELRAEGKTTVPVTSRVVNRPCIRNLDPSDEIFFPAWTIDPQEAPYVFLALHFTTEQLRAKVETEGWNKAWVERVIEQTRGDDPNGELWLSRDRRRGSGTATELFDDETIRVIYAFQRLMDADGTPGIYCTVFHPDLAEKTSDMAKPWAIHKMLPYRHGRYPFIVTKLEEWSKRLYETRSIPEIGKSWQQQYKVDVDAAIDRLSLSVLPPLEHPVGRAPSKWGPGVRVPYRVPGEYRYADIPRYDTGSLEMRQSVRSMCYEYFGRATEGGDPLEAQSKRQELADKAFSHVRDVMDHAFSLWQQYGPEAEWFRVIGRNEVKQFHRGSPDERYDFYLKFDVGLLDPELVVERVKAVAELQGLDRSGVLDTEALLQLAVEQILPGVADRVVIPRETATNKSVEEERSAIAELMAGVPPNVKPDDAHELKLQVFQQWLSQPDIQQRIQQDEAMRGRVENYVKQRTFQIQQNKNKEIGRMGGNPTGFGSTAAA